LEREMLVDRLELYGLFILGELSKSRTGERGHNAFFSHCTTPRVDENIAQPCIYIDSRMPNCFGLLF
jgi:hypothetical protein